MASNTNVHPKTWMKCKLVLPNQLVNLHMFSNRKEKNREPGTKTISAVSVMSFIKTQPRIGTNARYARNGHVRLAMDLQHVRNACLSYGTTLSDVEKEIKASLLCIKL